MKSLRDPRKAGRRVRRYAARLLFQFRIMANGNPGVRRLCEDRIIVLRAVGARSALARAQARGKAAEYQHPNADGTPVYFEFIGVTDLLELGAECEPDEVWYDIVQKVKPMERRKKLIPAPERLNAIAWERSNKPLERTGRARRSAPIR
jgi:Domain of unknown function (DUF4288)